MLATSSIQARFAQGSPHALPRVAVSIGLVIVLFQEKLLISRHQCKGHRLSQTSKDEESGIILSSLDTIACITLNGFTLHKEPTSSASLHEDGVSRDAEVHQLNRSDSRY